MDIPSGFTGRKSSTIQADATSHPDVQTDEERAVLLAQLRDKHKRARRELSSAHRDAVIQMKLRQIEIEQRLMSEHKRELEALQEQQLLALSKLHQTYTLAEANLALKPQNISGSVSEAQQKAKSIKRWPALTKSQRRRLDAEVRQILWLDVGTGDSESWSKKLAILRPNHT